MTGQDRHGKRIKVSGTGLLARAIQHEYDHLQGELYIDHLPPGDADHPRRGAARRRRGRRRGAGTVGVTPPTRVVFLGSGGFAVPILDALAASPDVELVGVS